MSRRILGAYSTQADRRRITRMEGMMAAIESRREAQVRTLTPNQARQEIDRLLAEAGMSREEIGQLGRDWKLDADGRGVLADIEGLEFLLERVAAGEP